MFPDIECFLCLKADPVYIERLAQDHLSFSDPRDEARKTKYGGWEPYWASVSVLISILLRMTLGYVHEIVRDGKTTYVKDIDAIACSVYNDSFDGETGKFKTWEELNSVHWSYVSAL